MSMNNLDYWNKVKQPPQNALKKIEFGYLKGKSDINPQWRLMAMTQAFGPVGHGWTYRIVRTWSEVGVGGAVMCFTEVAVKTKIDGQWGEEFFGIGGSEIIELAKGNPKANDEGYKKSTTDALGVAFKAVGVAADIYFGNYDGSKYLYDIQSAFFEKPKITDVRLEKAIEQINAGNTTKDAVINNFELTEDQLSKLNNVVTA